jgi:hypothetical protein
MTAPDDHRIRLIDRYFDRGLTPDQQAELEGEILADREARADFWDRARLHETLTEIGEEERGASLAALPDRPATTARPRRFAALAAAAAVLALAAALVVGLRPGENNPPAPAPAGPAPAPPRPAGVAVVGESAFAKWGGESPLAAGETLVPGPLHLIDGLAEIRLFGGAKLTLEGPARVELIDEARLRVDLGGVHADVPDAAAGFSVSFGGARIDHARASFGLRVAEDGLAALRLDRGELELVAVADGRKRMVRSQVPVWIRPDGQWVEAVASTFNAPAPLAEALARSSRARLVRWREFCRKLAGRSDLLVFLRLDEPAPGGADFLANDGGHPDGGGDAVLVSAVPTPGRWPGKSGLLFRAESDRVRLLVRGNHQQATLAAWIRPDDPVAPARSVFSSEAGLPGETHWHFGDGGQLWFATRARPGPADKAFLRVSAPALDAKAGAWRHVATSYDASTRRVIHYRDGKEIARDTLREAPPLAFGRATLGNSAGTPDDPWELHPLGGALDEFALFARALDATEIAEIHEAGAP